MKRFLFVQAIMLACLAWQLAAAPAGDPLDHWRQLNPDADLFDVAEVRFSNGRWVALKGRSQTNSPALFWSTNATEWKQAASTSEILSLAF